SEFCRGWCWIEFFGSRKKIKDQNHNDGSVRDVWCCILITCMLVAQTPSLSFLHHQLSLHSVVAVIAACILQASIQPPMALVSAPSASAACRLHNNDCTSIHIASASRGLKSLITLSPPLVTPLSRHVGIKSDSAPVYVSLALKTNSAVTAEHTECQIARNEK
ncbi:hypothetical protein B0H16DRAFT_1816691, partial [Mycena metata]